MSTIEYKFDKCHDAVLLEQITIALKLLIDAEGLNPDYVSISDIWADQQGAVYTCWVKCINPILNEVSEGGVYYMPACDFHKYGKFGHIANVNAIFDWIRNAPGFTYTRDNA